MIAPAAPPISYDTALAAQQAGGAARCIGCCLQHRRYGMEYHWIKGVDPDAMVTHWVE
jgi:hypothetical protein